VDAREAQASLDEVRAREHQVTRSAARQESPWWYVGGIAAVFLAVAVSTDLDDHWTGGWSEVVFSIVVPVAGLLVIAGLALALRRSLAVRSRRYSKGAKRGMLWLAVAFITVYIGLGTALRLADVGWDGSIAGVVATLVFLGGSALVRRSVLAESAPRGSRAD
jgi:hypothetical protein